jgi:hypothetical protein
MKPVSGTSKLTLEIAVVNAKGKTVKSVYDVRFLESAKEIGYPAWRLTKAGKRSEVYDVILKETGPECDCKDFGYRRQNQQKLCKHVESLRSRGLLRRDA